MPWRESAFAKSTARTGTVPDAARAWSAQRCCFEGSQSNASMAMIDGCSNVPEKTRQSNSRTCRVRAGLARAICKQSRSNRERNGYQAAAASACKVRSRSRQRVELKNLPGRENARLAFPLARGAVRSDEISPLERSGPSYVVNRICALNASREV